MAADRARLHALINPDRGKATLQARRVQIRERRERESTINEYFLHIQFFILILIIYLI
jgi:hypothetical protein